MLSDNELRHAHPRGVHQPQHRGVACGIRGVVAQRCAEQRVHLIGGQRLRNGLGRARRLDGGGWIAGEVTRVEQECAERLHRRDLAGDRRLRVALAVGAAVREPGDVVEYQLAIEALEGATSPPLSRSPPSPTAGSGATLTPDEIAEPREIVAVRVDRVLGGAALGRHVVQEGGDPLLHAVPLCTGHVDGHAAEVRGVYTCRTQPCGRPWAAARPARTAAAVRVSPARSARVVRWSRRIQAMAGVTAGARRRRGRSRRARSRRARGEARSARRRGCGARSRPAGG